MYLQIYAPELTEKAGDVKDSLIFSSDTLISQIGERGSEAAFT